MHALREGPQPVSPSSPAWNNSIAVCTAMRNENVTDVRETLAYYKHVSRCLRVCRLLLCGSTSNRSSNSMRIATVCLRGHT